MIKAVTYSGMFIAGLLALLFLLDLAISVPFKRASVPMDICFILASLVLGYLSWSTMKEQA